MTKEDILADLSLLPQATLERLQRYSQLLIIPEEDLLLNVTMSQMVDKAHRLADEHFPEWTDRSSSDFGTYLVELISLFSEKDFWYVNAFGNESLLSRMSVYSIAFLRSVELGHSPITAAAAQCTFDVSFEAGTSYTYLPGSLIIELPDSELKFTNRTSIIVPTSAFVQTIPLILHEGELVSDNQTFNGYRIDIRKPMVDLASVSLSIDSVDWSRVKVFGQSNPTSHHFITLPEEDGRASIFFGDSLYGSVPPINVNCELSYFVTKGGKGNGATDIARLNRYSPSRKATAVTRTGVPAGGTNPELLASLKNTALNYFTGKNVINNATAVEKWLNNQLEVKKSKAIIQGNKVYIRVVPTDGSVATTLLLNTLATRALPFASGGYEVYGLATTYVDVATISCTFYHLQGYDPLNIQGLGKQLIQDYTNPLILAEYGKDFTLSSLEFLLKSKIAGLQNVVFNTVAGLPATNITVGAYQILKKIDISDITINTFVV